MMKQDTFLCCYLVSDVIYDLFSHLTQRRGASSSRHIQHLVRTFCSSVIISLAHSLKYIYIHNTQIDTGGFLSKSYPTVIKILETFG